MTYTPSFFSHGAECVRVTVLRTVSTVLATFALWYFPLPNCLSPTRIPAFGLEIVRV
ncbi:hypothetical protein BHE74_00025073, partial [Ensete ventricosum]